MAYRKRGTCAPLSAHEQTRFRKRPRVPEPAEASPAASSVRRTPRSRARTLGAVAEGTPRTQERALGEGTPRTEGRALGAEDASAAVGAGSGGAESSGTRSGGGKGGSSGGTSRSCGNGSGTDTTDREDPSGSSGGSGSEASDDAGSGSEGGDSTPDSVHRTDMMEPISSQKESAEQKRAAPSIPDSTDVTQVFGVVKGTSQANAEAAAVAPASDDTESRRALAHLSRSLSGH